MLFAKQVYSFLMIHIIGVFEEVSFVFQMPLLPILQDLT